jgi:hypothetical protein
MRVVQVGVCRMTHYELRTMTTMENTRGGKQVNRTVEIFGSFCCLG